MNKSIGISLFLSLIFGTSINLFSQSQYIHCGHLVDVQTASDLGPHTIVVEDGIIATIIEGYVVPRSETSYTVDLGSHYVIPGLMDMHVHMEWETNPTRYMEKYVDDEADIAFNSVVFARRTLLAGFTTVRDLGGTGVNINLRDAINAGKITGPRIYTCGKALSTTGGHQDPTTGSKRELMGRPGPESGVINGPGNASEGVRQQYKNGADQIKITATGGVLSVAKDGKRPHFTQEELDAIVATAKDYDMHVAAHAHGAEGMKRAVLAGVTSIEHGTMMDEEIMALMKERGTWYVPTITAGKSVEALAKVPGYFPDIIVPKALEVGPRIQETTGKVYAHGVNIVFGTDAGVFPHGENAKEFKYMTEVGIPMSECLQMATIRAASMLGIDAQAGSLEEGKWADIVALKGNPLEDPDAMMSIDFVMKSGIIYKMNGAPMPEN